LFGDVKLEVRSPDFLAGYEVKGQRVEVGEEGEDFWSRNLG
jgi:hypothetical protein